MTAQVLSIHDGYFARAQFYNWRARVDRRNGLDDEAYENEIMGRDAQRIGVRIRAQVQADQPGLNDYLRQRQAEMQENLAS